MRSPSRSLLAVTLALAFCASPALADFGRDAYTPVTISPMFNATKTGGSAPDGSGGMYVAWTDQHAGSNSVYVQRLTGAGALAPSWPVGGIRVSALTSLQQYPMVASDGAGGVIVVWSDARGATQDIYATRLQGNGVLAGGWPVNGLLISTSGPSTLKDEIQPQLIPDGANGAFVVWTLNYGSNDDDIYGARVTGAGTVAWSTSVYGPNGVQGSPQIISDNAGGFYVGFADNENGVTVKAKLMRIFSTGNQAWSPRLLGTGANQSGFSICSDGGTGAYALVSDNGPVSYYSLVGNHYRADGTNDPQWGSNYKFVVSIPNISQGSPLIVPDGAGGFVAAFDDNRNGPSDLFAVRVTAPYWFAAAGWPSTGTDLMYSGGSHFPVGMIPDGTGGAVIQVYDNRQGDYFIYATRIMGNNALAPGWPYNGRAVELGGFSDISGVYDYWGIVPDGNGGALFSWGDQRGAPQFSTFTGIYAQNIDRFGAYGDARPKITKIADVPMDQGGQVSLQWSASYLDALPTLAILQYSVWRRVPGGTAAAAASSAPVDAAGGTNAQLAPVRAGEAGAPNVAEATRVAAAAAHEPALLSGVFGAQVVYWEFVGNTPARELAGYSMVVPTTSDSMPAGNPRTSLMVMAEFAGGPAFWSSAPDSGYSVDNIPPYAPAPFLGTYSGGVSAMHWSPVLVSDLSNYRLYRGTSASFTPSPSNLVASPGDTTYSDAAGSPFYYRLTAVDIHGNESASTLLLPSGALDVGRDPLPTELAFAQPGPNPAREATELHYSMPRAGSVRLTLFDTSGRRVRLLLDGPEGPGQEAVTWDLRDDAGNSVRPGLYFARFESEGRSFTRRVMIVR